MKDPIGYLRVSIQEQGRSGLGFGSQVVVQLSDLQSNE